MRTVVVVVAVVVCCEIGISKMMFAQVDVLSRHGTEYFGTRA